MSFDSLGYLLFLPLIAAAYRLCPPKSRWCVLLAGSYFFYMQWNAELAWLIFGVTVFTWGAGRWMECLTDARQKRMLMGASALVCMGLLGYFKYFTFLSESLSAVSVWLGGGAFRTWDVILPVGVSFYTFQAMSYVIDVYRGRLKAEKHFGYYALYVSFFPQLVAGPIERTENLLPQLKAHKNPDREDMRQGVRLLLSGFFRKVVIADFAGQFVERVYSLSVPDGASVCIATMLFALQIYCDFSGYSEIAAGSARFLGVRLMRNFDRPYLAENIREFWRRWHISLTTWFTDYVYIPMGGSRRGLARQMAATMTVFAFSGLWHGAAWTFVVWGLMHGAAMCAEILLRRRRVQSTVSKMFRRVSTLAFVCLAWIFFRAESLPHAFMLCSRLFTAWDWQAALAQLNMTAADAVRLVLTLAMFPALHRLSLTEEREGDMTYVLFALAIALAWLVRLESHAVSAFIYFQF